MYLNSGFSQIDFQCQLLSGVDVRVVSFRKNPLQLLQLRAGEGGPDAPLLPLLVQPTVIGEQFVGNCKPNKNVTVSCAVVLSVQCETCGVLSCGSKFDILYKIRLSVLG